MDKIAAALVKATAEFATVHKDKTANVKSDKGSYSYNYADLASVLEAVTPALTKNGLVLVQRPIWDPNLTSLSLESRLLHESGQWIAGSYPLPTASRPQEMGSALTYARRYSATAILGIAAEEDDDGNRAEGNQATNEQRQPSPRKPSEPMPECPTCNITEGVILSKYPGKKYYHLGCKGRFGPSNSPADEPGAEEAADLFIDGKVVARA